MSRPVIYSPYADARYLLLTVIIATVLGLLVLNLVATGVYPHRLLLVGGRRSARVLSGRKHHQYPVVSNQSCRARYRGRACALRSIPLSSPR